CEEGLRLRRRDLARVLRLSGTPRCRRGLRGGEGRCCAPRERARRRAPQRRSSVLLVGLASRGVALPLPAAPGPFVESRHEDDRRAARGLPLVLRGAWTSTLSFVAARPAPRGPLDAFHF